MPLAKGTAEAHAYRDCGGSYSASASRLTGTGSVERKEPHVAGDRRSDGGAMGLNTEEARAEALTSTVSAGVAPSHGSGVTIAGLDAPVSSIGAFMNPKHQYWYNGVGPVPSVTTVLGIIDKPAIVTWKSKATATAIIEGWPTVCELITNEGQEAAIRWAMREADKTRDSAASLGSSVHLLADIEGIGPGASEKPVEGFEVSEQVQPYLEAYRAFLGRYTRSAIVSSEHMVWSLNGYAGTYDLLMTIDGELWLLDIKTSGKGPYPEWGLQLAAYRWADSIVLPNNPNPYPMPLVQRTGVLHLQPELYKEGWSLIEYPTTYRDYVAFLGALEVYSWKSEGRFTKSKLVGRQKPISTKTHSEEPSPLRHTDSGDKQPLSEAQSTEENRTAKRRKIHV